MNKRTLVVRGKNNITTRDKVTTLGFLQSAKHVGTDPKTTEPIWAPYIDWLPEPLDITAEEAMADAGKERGRRAEAEEFLTEELMGGPAEQSAINKNADDAGISAATLRRAKKSLQIESQKEKRIGGRWFWRLPNRGHGWPWDAKINSDSQP